VHYKLEMILSIYNQYVFQPVVFQPAGFSAILSTRDLKDRPSPPYLVSLPENAREMQEYIRCPPPPGILVLLLIIAVTYSCKYFLTTRRMAERLMADGKGQTVNFRFEETVTYEQVHVTKSKATN